MGGSSRTLVGWVISPHLQVLFIHGPSTHVRSSVNILFQLQSLPLPPGLLCKVMIWSHLFHQMLLHQGDLTQEFFSTFQKKCCSDTQLVSVFSCWAKFEDCLSLSFSLSLFSYRVTDWFKLERTLKIISFQPLPREGHLPLRPQTSFQAVFDNNFSKFFTILCFDSIIRLFPRSEISKFDFICGTAALWMCGAFVYQTNAKQTWYWEHRRWFRFCLCCLGFYNKCTQ